MEDPEFRKEWERRRDEFLKNPRLDAKTKNRLEYKKIYDPELY